MDYEYWTKTINEEDRKINNANRRFRYHCYSLESMSEELIYQERSLFPHNDFTTELFNEDFIDTVQNEKLAKALRRLTDRQKQAIKLAFGRDISTRKLRQYSSVVRRRLRYCFKERSTGSGNI